MFLLTKLWVRLKQNELDINAPTIIVVGALRNDGCFYFFMDGESWKIKSYVVKDRELTGKTKHAKRIYYASLFC